MGMDEGRTVTPLTMDIDITVDGEYEQHGEVKVVMTDEQLDKLAELLGRHVDLDVVSLDNDDPEGALFVQMLTYAIKHRKDPQS
jgi:hypothetical protein